MLSSNRWWINNTQFVQQTVKWLYKKLHYYPICDHLCPTPGTAGMVNMGLWSLKVETKYKLW